MPSPGPSSSRAARPKHIPQRTCVVCRETAAKRTLIRIVRTPDGAVEVDPTGRMNGRGAYLCTNPACWSKAVSTPILAKALRIDVTDETTHRLATFAATALPSTGDSATDPKEAPE